MKKIKICILGYKELTEMAKKAIKGLELQDTEFMVMDCTPEHLPGVVDSAVRAGCEMFVGGGSNYAAFKRYSSMFIQELPVTDIDYLIAIRKAQKLGRYPAIVRYVHSQPINIAFLSDLSGTPVSLITYEYAEELPELLSGAGSDVFIGTALVRDYALGAGKQYVLSYAGIETIRASIIRARNRAIVLRREQRYDTVNRALLRDTEIGILITNEYGYVTIINKKAESYLGITTNSAHGRLLDDVQPNLALPRQKTEAEDAKDRNSASLYSLEDSYRIIRGVRYRCSQKPLLSKGDLIGYMTTLRIDNTRSTQKSSAEKGVGAEKSAHKWYEIAAYSESMARFVEEGKKLANSPLPVALFGEKGVHKMVFAECLHSGSVRAEKPLIIANLAAISENDAGRHLLGCCDENASHTGLLEMANGGTLVMFNLDRANSAVQSCILDAVTYHRITKTGGVEIVSLDIRYVTVLDSPAENKPAGSRTETSDDTFNAPSSYGNAGLSAISRISPGLLSLLTILELHIPPIRERREDIVPLFEREVRVMYTKPYKIGRFPKAADVLRWYDWPGNLSEIQACAARFCTALQEKSPSTAAGVFRAIVDSIGMERIIMQAQEKFNTASAGQEADAFAKMVEELGKYTGMSQGEIASCLGMSRSSLWRKLGK